MTQWPVIANNRQNRSFAGTERLARLRFDAERHRECQAMLKRDALQYDRLRQIPVARLVPLQEPVRSGLAIRQQVDDRCGVINFAGGTRDGLSRIRCRQDFAQ